MTKMYYLADFARPKGSKDKIQRKKRHHRAIAGVIGALGGTKAHYLLNARNKKVWDKLHKGKVAYTAQNILKGAIVPSLVGAGTVLTINELGNRLAERRIAKNKNPLVRRKKLERLYDVS